VTIHSTHKWSFLTYRLEKEMTDGFLAYDPLGKLWCRLRTLQAKLKKKDTLTSKYHVYMKILS